MLSNQWFGRFLKVYLLWLPWQPEFFMEHNYLKEFERGHLRNIPEKFGKITVNSLRSFLKEKFTDARTEEWTHDGHNSMTIAHWPLASGAKNQNLK